MLIPTINPDEFGQGYLIRLGIVNGLKNYDKTVELIRPNKPAISKNYDLAAIHIATLNNLSLERYCRQHTLLPVHRAITNIRDTVRHGSFSHPYFVRRYAHFDAKRILRICQECISEDLKYLGYSYYRRSHQYPGVFRCNKHHFTGQLLSFRIGDNFVDPVQALNVSKITPQFDNVVINRYIDVIDGLCDFEKPVNQSLLVNKLFKISKEKNLIWGGEYKKSYLNDYIVNNLPEDWVSQITPNNGYKRISPHTSLSFILMLAILYSTADEALLLLKEVNNGSVKTNSNVAAVT